MSPVHSAGGSPKFSAGLGAPKELSAVDVVGALAALGAPKELSAVDVVGSLAGLAGSS